MGSNHSVPFDSEKAQLEADGKYALVTVGNVRGNIHYVLQASSVVDAPLVVLMHGIGGASDIFSAIQDKLANAGFRSLRFDSFGRGFSDAPKNAKYDDDMHLGVLRALLQTLGLGDTRFVLIGHSMGGAMACLYAERYPQSVTALVLLAPAGLGDLPPPLPCLRSCSCCGTYVACLLSCCGSTQDSVYREGVYDQKGALANRVVARMRAYERGNVGIREAVFYSAMRCSIAGIENTVRTLAQRQLPVLLMFGDADVTVPTVPSLERYRKLLQLNDSQVVLVPETSHLFFLEKPELCDSAIVQFCLRAVEKPRILLAPAPIVYG